MATKYEVSCDVCGAVVKGLEQTLDVKRANWHVRVDNYWLDDSTEEGKALTKDIEFTADVCEACAKKTSVYLKTFLAKPQA